MLLTSTGADVIGLNEASRFRARLSAMPDHTWHGGDGSLLANNPVLLRNETIEFESMEARQLCDAVGTSPARSGVTVKFRAGGHKRAHISTHLNAHIQVGGEPRNLPRVKEAMRHMIRLEAWVRELQAEGYKVTVTGDFNWDWTLEDARDWTYSPEATFARLGFVSQFEHPTWPGGGTLGGREIDYFLYDPTDLKIVDQRIVVGEHSDHRWVQVETETI